MTQTLGTTIAANTGKSLANIGAALGTADKKTISKLTGYNAKAAATANAISNSAQTAQGAFNQASIDQANAITQANLEKQMEYNSAEAEKNRNWQEKMASTAYQRTVQDMIKAGINPILASQLGATSVGNGATASIGAPSGQAASIGNYTGQMENTNGWLALLGIAADAFSNLGTALQTLGADKDISMNFGETVNNFLEWIMNKNGNPENHSTKNGEVYVNGKRTTSYGYKNGQYYSYGPDYSGAGKKF